MSPQARLANAASTSLVALGTFILMAGILLIPNFVIADDVILTTSPVAATTCTGTDCTKCGPLNGGCVGGCGGAGGNCLDNNGNACGCGQPVGYTKCTCTY